MGAAGQRPHRGLRLPTTFAGETGFIATHGFSLFYSSQSPTPILLGRGGEQLGGCCWGQLTAIRFGTQRGAGGRDRFGQAVLGWIYSCYLLLLVPVLNYLLPFLLHVKPQGFLIAAVSFCCLLCCLSPCFTLAGRPTIKALALSQVWRLAPALLPSQYHLMVTFLLFFSRIDVSNLLIMARSASSHPHGCDQ